MIVNAYLVITASRSRYNSYSYTLRVTKQEPSLNSNEIAMKLKVNVPDEVFKRPVPLLELDVPKEIVMNPDAEVAARLTADTIADALQLDVETVTDGLLTMIKDKQEKQDAQN